MNEQPGRRGQSVVSAVGLTVLYGPHQPSVDVVFVHGLIGHPERTWTGKREDVGQQQNDVENPDSVELADPASKSRKFNQPSQPHYEKGEANTRVYWPRDLLPVTIPQARVLTYGYDSHIRHWTKHPIGKSTIYDIAGDLLVALESERRTEPLRPVIFIGHSLGGIIVKETLWRSRGRHLGQIHLRDIFESTIGIIFFGTPHAGADPAGSLQGIAQRVLKAVGLSVNEQIINSLLPSQEHFKEVRDEFGPIAQQQSWIIHSFQEQFGINVLMGQKVVDDTSSYLGNFTVETTEHIGRNHMDMCRFIGFDDLEYKKVAASLRRMISTLSRQDLNGETSLLNKGQKQTLLGSLRFDQIDARQINIKTAHPKTCKWLLKNSEYLDWLDPNKFNEHRGFLWIKGKPGTGKSTLMKFALAHAQKKMKDKIVISFFFNARGDDLEKSRIGMYRSLLLQLLKRLPVLQDVFDSLGLATWNSECHQWNIAALESLFEHAIQNLGESSLACFIDALDECDWDQIRDIVSFFEHMGELTASVGIRFQVCFSSRHYPHITTARGLSLILEIQEGHSQDIVSYLESELKIGHSKLAEQIRIDLQQKASGLFIWIVLVVGLLNKEYDGGRIHRLQQRLRNIPGDLHNLFLDILARDSYNRDELLLCIQWLLFATQPLKPEQLYFAILSGVVPEVLSKWNRDEVTIHDMERFILSSSKGLAAITNSKVPRVQFIHESVRDFLLKENAPWEFWPGRGRNIQGESHDSLKQSCLNYMSFGIANLNVGDSFWKASPQDAVVFRPLAGRTYPLLEYATRNVLYHAEAAEASGVKQEDIIGMFPLANWIKLNNFFERFEVRRYTPSASLLYILAENNMSALIRAHPSNSSCFDVGDERYGSPIFAALATGSTEAVQAFLDVQTQIRPRQSSLCHLLEHNPPQKSERIGFSRSFTFSRQRGVLSHIAEEGDEVILHSFLTSCDVVINSKDNYGRTALLWAAMRGHEAVAKLLLDCGASIESRDHEGQTPLLWAATNGHEGVVKMLLENGADIGLGNNARRTPLSQAAENGHERIVRLLLDRGTGAELKAPDGSTPLLLAAANGHKAVAQILLDYGASYPTSDQGYSGYPWTQSHMPLADIQAPGTRALKPRKLPLPSPSSTPRAVPWAQEHDFSDSKPHVDNSSKAVSSRQSPENDAVTQHQADDDMGLR